MRVSLNWAARLIGCDSFATSDETMLEELTDHLAEIEGIESAAPELPGVVVGHVLSCEQHPDADRLRVCSVDVGGEDHLSIVCGAPNVAAGQKVAVATIGTVLQMPNKDGGIDEVKIKKGKLRGVLSQGMICAEDELGIGDDHDGILVLPEAAHVGSPLKDALPGNDKILDIDNHNINHRPDLWGHLGWARELAIIFNKDIPAAANIEFNNNASNWSVDIQDALCATYCGAVIENVDNRPSPEWMQACLISAGVRPLGLLVDITNYVMLELGEPMHAFDRRQINGSQIIVRAAKDGETFTTLDDQEHTLQAGDLLICDNEKSLALAGIMGGQGSMVQEDTTSIVLEAAIFDAGRIRQTRIRTGLSTESSNRFEKSLFPSMAPAAINRAIELITEIIPEATVSEQFYSGKLADEARLISYDYQLARRLVGIDLSDAQQQDHLEKLGFTLQGDQWLVPWWRHKDIEAEIDFVEEVSRIHGYAQLPAEVPRLPAAVPQLNKLRQAEHRCRSIMSGQGWDEIVTYTFTSDKWANHLQWPEDICVRLDHPLSSEQTIMRYNLLPTMFDAVVRNRRHFNSIQCYEIGKIYGQGIYQAPCNDERLCIAGCSLAAGDDEVFYHARDAALSILESLGYSCQFDSSAKAEAGFDQGRHVGLKVGNKLTGFAAEIDAATRKAHKCRDQVGFFHIELEALVNDGPVIKPISMQTPSRFQSVEREFTWVCPEHLSWDEIAQSVQSAAGKLCREIDLLTVYRGEQIEDQHKAVSMKVTLQADDRTLSEKELQKTSKKIISTVEHKTVAKLRA